jgi:hypothetical protein
MRNAGSPSKDADENSHAHPFSLSPYLPCSAADAASESSRPSAPSPLCHPERARRARVEIPSRQALARPVGIFRLGRRTASLKMTGCSERCSIRVHLRDLRFPSPPSRPPCGAAAPAAGRVGGSPFSPFRLFAPARARARKRMGRRRSEFIIPNFSKWYSPQPGDRRERPTHTR